MVQHTKRFYRRIPMPLCNPKTCMLIVAIAMAGCGTAINSGQNAQRYLQQIHETNAKNSQQAGSSDAVGEQNQFSLTCSGPAPELPKPYQDLCAHVSALPNAEFQSIKSTICDDQRLVGLLYQACSYRGEPEAANKIRIIHQTPIQDTSSTFSYLSAYSITIPMKPDMFKQQIISQYTDPDFPKTHTMIANSRITSGVYDASSEKISYGLELNSSAASVSFDGEILFHSWPTGSAVFLDWAVNEKVLIQEYGLMMLVVPISEEESRLIIVDHTEVEDDGNHTLALRTLMNLDIQRMEMLYENAHQP